MLNKKQKFLAWMHLLLSLIIIIGTSSFLFTSPDDDFYFFDQIASAPEAGLIYEVASNINKYVTPVTESYVNIKSFAGILHVTFLGSHMVMFFMLIIVLFFPKEERVVLPSGIDFNYTFYFILGMQLIWMIAFFELGNMHEIFLDILLLTTLYYSLYPVLKMNERLRK